MDNVLSFNIPDIKFMLDVNLDRYTTIKLGGNGNIAIVRTLEALKELIQTLDKHNIEFHIVGWGANQVLFNTDKYLYIKLDFEYDRSYLKEVREEYDLPASFPLNILTSHATKFGLLGWEVFTGVPASLGGAICMNAGTSLGEICEIVKEVTVLKPDGELYTYKKEELAFEYRRNNFLKPKEIIVSAVLVHKGIDTSQGERIKKYLQYRKDTQPLTTKNCGSVFKNLGDFRAGITIDKCGLKGFGTDNIQVSHKHGNFIENNGEGTSEEFVMVVENLQKEIERYSGRKFELEVKIY